MARDNSGNYDLPAGNPVVTQTTISSSVHNSTMADIAAAMEDSLSRSGKGGMLAALSMGSNRITSLADPVNNTDAANKQWVVSVLPSIVNGSESDNHTLGSNWSEPVGPGMQLVLYTTLGYQLSIVHFNFYLEAAAGASFTSIATLDSGIRPRLNDFVVFGTFWDASAGAGTEYPCQFKVSAGGVLSAYQYDNGTSLTSMPTLGAGDTISVSGTFITL